MAKYSRLCAHKLNDGKCALTGKNMGETCIEFRCRSFQRAEAAAETEEKEEKKEMWKPEYNRNRLHPTTTSSEVKARYNRKAYDRLTLTLPKGSAELLKEEAASKGMSVNRLLVDVICREMPECIAFGGGGAITSLKALWAEIQQSGEFPKMNKL